MVIKPAFLDTRIAAMQTIDCMRDRQSVFYIPISSLFLFSATWKGRAAVGASSVAAYLDSKVEQVQVPVLSRHTVLVDDGHGNGREAVGQDGEAGAVLELCDAGGEGGRVGGQPVM